MHFIFHVIRDKWTLCCANIVPIRDGEEEMTFTKLLRSGIIPLTALALSACSNQSVNHYAPDFEAPAPVSINDDYLTGSMDMPNVDIPELGRIRNMYHYKSKAKTDAEVDAMKSAATSYAIQAGLEWGTKAVDAHVNSEANKLSRIYDFNALSITSPQGQIILPPVIAEMDNSYELQDGGRSLRVADKTYQIIENARFSQEANIWQTYLFHSYEKPAVPDEKMLPGNRNEQVEWVKSVDAGWDVGVRQAIDTFKQDFNRLTRDFKGMALYHQLEEEGKVSSPVVAEDQMGITGSADKVRYNDRNLNITDYSHLNYDHPDKMKSSASTMTPDDASQSPSDIINRDGN
mgnify:CR=1 FL=1